MQLHFAWVGFAKENILTLAKGICKHSDVATIRIEIVLGSPAGFLVAFA